MIQNIHLSEMQYVRTHLVHGFAHRGFIPEKINVAVFEYRGVGPSLFRGSS